LTQKGNIKITDRKKSIFVSSGGKNIAPQPIENAISQSKFIDQCVLIGDNRDFNAALIVPNLEQMKLLAEHLNIIFSNDTGLISNPQIIDSIQKDIDIFQKDFAKYERVRKFKLLKEPFSVETGELTPKMSIKRQVIEKKYENIIKEMYSKE
jgi:long-chain acyl-CoA synthetase